MNRRYRFGPGAALITLLAVVLAMSALGVLTLVSARGDEVLSERAARVAVLGHHHAAVDARAQPFMRCARHLPGGLAGGHEDDAARAKVDLIERLRHGRAGHGLAQRGVQDLLCMRIHESKPPIQTQQAVARPEGGRRPAQRNAYYRITETRSTLMMAAMPMTSVPSVCVL